MTPEWLLAADGIASIDNGIKAGFGTEYQFKLGADMAVTGRAGYNTRTKDMTGLVGLSAGLGVAYGSYGVDYAFVPFGDLGTTHRISTGANF